MIHINERRGENILKMFNQSTKKIKITSSKTVCNVNHSGKISPNFRRTQMIHHKISTKLAQIEAK